MADLYQSNALLPQDAPHARRIATALTAILEPSPGHSLSLDSVRDAVLAAGVRSVPYGALKRVLRAAGVQVVSEGSRNMLVIGVRFADGDRP